MTLANQITIGRLLLTPFFVLLTVYYADGVAAGHSQPLLRLAALTTFAATALTDALDGYFARSRRERTRLGTLLDPLADKFLLTTGLVLLAGPWGRAFEARIPVWYVVLALSRDGLLVAGWFLIHHMVGHVIVRPRAVGKVTTVLQMTLIVWILAAAPPAWFPWILGAATAGTLTSAALYLRDGIRQLEKAHPHDPPPAP
jgi:CDP-diacylglycerol--glycerol-3-phosphate 3-phosphatidyltransferase